MALDVASQNIDQVGKRFLAHGVVFSNASSADASATLVDIDDLDMNPFNKPATEFGSFKIVKFSLTGHSALDGTAGRFALEWDATAPVTVTVVPNAGTITASFKEYPQGGLVNPQGTGSTGDLDVDYLGSSALDDRFGYIIEGELIP